MTSVAASLTLSSSTQDVSTFPVIDFTESLLSSATSSLQPSNSSPRFIVETDGTLKCVEAGLYNITLSCQCSQNGSSYPYTASVFINVTGLNSVVQDEKSVTQSVMSLSETVQVKLAVNDTIQCRYMLTGTSPVLIKKGTTLLVTQLE